MPDDRETDTSLTLLERLQIDPDDPAGLDPVRRALPAADSTVVPDLGLARLRRRRRGPGGAGQAVRGAPQVPVRPVAQLPRLAQDRDPARLERLRRRPAQGPRPQRRTGSTPIADSAEARSDLERQLEDAFDRELLEVAMHRIKNRVKPATWDAFHLTAVEGLSGADAARQARDRRRPRLRGQAPRPEDAPGRSPDLEERAELRCRSRKQRSANSTAEGVLVFTRVPGGLKGRRSKARGETPGTTNGRPHPPAA